MIDAVRTYDQDLIRRVISSPEIAKTICEDGMSIEDVTIDVDGECWLALVSSDGVVGVYNLHPWNSVTLQIHAHVLQKYRSEHKMNTGWAALRWIYENAANYLKVVALVPSCYKNVRDFTCSFGFSEEGLIRQSYRKDGQLVDQYLLGITREEIEAGLNEQSS